MKEISQMTRKEREEYLIEETNRIGYDYLSPDQIVEAIQKLCKSISACEARDAVDAAWRYNQECE